MNINVVKAEARELEARRNEQRAILAMVAALVLAGVSITMAAVFRQQRDTAREECRR